VTSTSPLTSGARPERPEHLAKAAFVVLLVLAFALILIETRGLSFFADEWDFLLDRRGMSARVLLTPHGPHLSLVPVLIYKALLQVFGSSSYLPFRCMAAIDLVLLAWTVGVVSRREWGPWWGLIPVLLLVALGPGYTTLLYPFQVGYTLGLVGGMLCLVTLRWRTPRGDILACSCLLLSLASASQGVGFAAGAALLLVTTDGWRYRNWIRRAWVVAIPVALYVAWYLDYGRQASESELSLWSKAFWYTLNGVAATISGLFALTKVQSDGLLDPSLGWPILLGAVLAVVYAAARGWRPQKAVWAPVVTLLVLWFTTALSNTPEIPRAFNDPRYLSSNGSILLIVVCMTIPRPRLPRRIGGLMIALVGVIALANVSQYAPGRAALRASMTYTRAETGALLVMRGSVRPSFNPSFIAHNPGVTTNITAGTFFSAYESFGTFLSDSPSQIRLTPEAVRAVVDNELQRGERLQLSEATRGASPIEPAPTVLRGAGRIDKGCELLISADVVVEASPGTYVLTAPRRTAVKSAVARFASSSVVDLGSVPPHRSETLSIPDDHAASVPWRLDLVGRGGLVCRTTSANS
jgi:hypothetical protein